MATKPDRRPLTAGRFSRRCSSPRRCCQICNEHHAFEIKALAICTPEKQHNFGEEHATDPNDGGHQDCQGPSVDRRLPSSAFVPASAALVLTNAAFVLAKGTLNPTNAAFAGTNQLPSPQSSVSFMSISAAFVHTSAAFALVSDLPSHESLVLLSGALLHRNSLKTSHRRISRGKGVEIQCRSPSLFPALLPLGGTPDPREGVRGYTDFVRPRH